jgi:hypothetical protein
MVTMPFSGKSLAQAKSLAQTMPFSGKSLALSLSFQAKPYHIILSSSGMCWACAWHLLGICLANDVSTSFAKQMPSRCQAHAKQHARQRPFTGPGALFRQRFIIYSNGSGNTGKQGLVQATVPSSDNGSGSTGKQGLVQATVPSSHRLWCLFQAMVPFSSNGALFRQ